jgi:hypothetical protein
MQQYPVRPQGHVACHLRTLAMLINGLIGSRKTSLSAIATHTPTAAKRQSRIQRFERWLKNERIDAEVYFLPCARALLSSLPNPLVLVMDASEVGRGCLALKVNVVYQKRALPLCWTVVKGKKGHLSEQTHIQLLQRAASLLTAERCVIFLGDGEFDGPDLLAMLEDLGWNYVCRTAKNAQLCEEGEWFSFAWLNVEPGECIEIPDVRFTNRAYGPLLAVAVWDKDQKEPLYLISNLDFGEEAADWYRRRFRIETFFSDLKSRGFYLAHSHISDPKRMARLLIAVCLAYLFLVLLGAQVVQKGGLSIIHRTKRCDLSLFQIGLTWLQHCLNEGLHFQVAFQLPNPMVHRNCVG